MSSSDRVKVSLGDSGEEGGHIQGSVTLLSRLGVILKRLVLKNGHLGNGMHEEYRRVCNKVQIPLAFSMTHRLYKL